MSGKDKEGAGGSEDAREGGAMSSRTAADEARKGG